MPLLRILELHGEIEKWLRNFVGKENTPGILSLGLARIVPIALASRAR
jgi:hypothetical protein